MTKTKKIYEGNLYYEKGVIYDYEEITGNISSYGGTIETGAFPKLVSNGGNIYSGGGNIESGAFPALTSNGGDISSNGGTIETGAFPALTSNGGHIFSGGTIETGAFPKNIVKNDEKNTAKELSWNNLFFTFLKLGFVFCDKMLVELLDKKTIKNTTIYNVKMIGKNKRLIIVQKGSQFSHGKTLKEAKESLKYKIGNRDTSAYRSWKLDDIKTQAELIQSYRVITGACEFGTRCFCENNPLPRKCSVKKAIELTTGQYGSEEFKDFFTKKGEK